VVPRAQQIAGKKQAKRSIVAARQKRMSILLRKRKPLISIEVLRKLAASNLPNDKQVYTAKLNELLGT